MQKQENRKSCSHSLPQRLCRSLSSSVFLKHFTEAHGRPGHRACVFPAPGLTLHPLSHPGCPLQAWMHACPPNSEFPPADRRLCTYPYIASLSLLRASLTEEPILGGMVLVWAVCGYWWECSWGPWLRCTACMDRAPCGSPYMVVGMPTPSIP